MRYFETETQERIGYDFYCDIAQRIVEARKIKGYTQEMLSKESKIPLPKLSRIELVQTRISLTDLKSLSNALDVTVNWLIEAEIDSQVGDCLYLVWPEKLPDVRLYRKSTSKRLAFLDLTDWLKSHHKLRFLEPRDRAIVKLVGIPITEEELKDKFPKLTSDEESILPD